MATRRARRMNTTVTLPEELGKTHDDSCPVLT